MDILTLALLIAIGSYIVNHQQQRKRIALLASHLGHYQIEKLMEALTEGYLRALGESTPERRDQIWSLLTTTESQLSEQFNRFAAEFAQVNEADARVSRFAMAIPFASQLFPGTTFDMRKALAIHARGIENMARNAAQLAPRDKALPDNSIRSAMFRSIAGSTDPLPSACHRSRRVFRMVAPASLHLRDARGRSLPLRPIPTAG